MIKPETLARVEALFAKLNDDEAILVQSMVNEIERLQKKVKQQDERLNEYSWTVNPDRMGGQFTDEEINRYRDGRW